jgi:hypothetical protein
MSVPPIFPFLGGTLPPLIKERLRPEVVSEPVPMIEEERRPPMRPGLDMGGIGMLQAGRIGPLNRLGQFINQELAEENQGEVDEFIGEVGDMANQRFGVDLGSVGQRPMFDVGRPVQAYKEGGAAFPDLSGDGKITQKDILIGRGVIEKEYGGPVGMQMGGDPMMAANMPPPQAPPMPMPAPEQPPMPMEAPQDQLDPNVVQSALAQAAGGIGDLDQAQNYEQVMNTMRGDQATVEERRQELAGVVGPGDAGQTPESVLTLVQPVMMLANVDQGIGQLAQQEMTQPMEGPMAGGIMSTVPEPPMMEAGGTAPVNFNKGGEVRPVEYFSPLNSNRIAGGGNQFSFNPAFPYIPTGESPINLLRVTGLLGQSGDEDAENKVNSALNAEKNNPGTGKTRLQELFANDLELYRKVGLGDVAERQAMAEQQKRMTKAQMLFDIATTALAFAAPMEGERPGLSPAERLAMAARSTQLPEKIGARAQAQLQLDKEAAKEERAIELAALQSAETKLAAEKAASAAERLAALKSKTKDRVLRTIGNKIVDVTDPTNPVVVFEGDEERDIRTIEGQLIDITDSKNPQILFGEKERKTQTVGGNIVDITDADNVKVIYKNPEQNVRVVNNQLIDFTDITKPKVIYGEKPIKTVTVDNQVINITDPANPTVIFGEKPIKTATVGGQLLNITDPTKVEVLFGKPDIDIRTIGSEVVDFTDPANPRVIYGEKERKTITLKGQVLDITDPDNVSVIFGEKDKDYKVVNGQLVEIQEDGQPKAIFGEKTPRTGTFENMLLESGEMILVKKVGEDLYDTDGTKIDRASDKYKGALLISKDTAFDVSTTAKSQAKFKELLTEKQNLRDDNDLRNQILNPEGNLVSVLPSEQGDRARTMNNTFNALKAARQGVGFWNKLKQAFSEVVGGVIPPLENVFKDEVAAGNFINAVNVLTRVALANSPRFAEGEQERLGTLLPSTDRLFANRENAVRKLIGIKKLLKQEEINVLEILSGETDKNILRENKRQMYAIKSALKLLETVPDVGFINSEEFENTMDILMKRRQERGEP